MNFIKHIQPSGAPDGDRDILFDIKEACVNLDRLTIRHLPKVSHIDYFSKVDGHMLFGDAEVRKMNEHICNTFNGARIDSFLDHCRSLFLKDATFVEDPLPLHNLFHDGYVRFNHEVEFGNLAKHVPCAASRQETGIEEPGDIAGQKIPRYAIRVQYVAFPMFLKTSNGPDFIERVFDRYSGCSLIVSLVTIRADENGDIAVSPLAGICVNKDGPYALGHELLLPWQQNKGDK